MKTLKITDETHRRLTMVKGELMAHSGTAELTYDDAILKLIEQWGNTGGVQGRSQKPLKPYQFTRFKWGYSVDLKKAEKELGEKFSVEWKAGMGDDMEISLHARAQDARDVLKIKADTLGAFLDIYKAVLYQRTAAPFTARDLELRDAVFDLYTRNRPTPLPIGFPKEPEFTVEEEKN